MRSRLHALAGAVALIALVQPATLVAAPEETPAAEETKPVKAEPKPEEAAAKPEDAAAKPEMTPEEAAKKAAEACEDGKVMDAEKKECVEATPETEKKTLWENGRNFANAGQYERAIRTLELAEMTGDARVLSYLGFSHRKLGHLLVAMGYYEAAVAADPDYVKVREYMGEGFIQMGNIEAARGQLAEIGKRCGTGCAEYALLAQAIGTAETARN